MTCPKKPLERRKREKEKQIKNVKKSLSGATGCAADGLALARSGLAMCV
jgi:hypothetical protein